MTRHLPNPDGTEFSFAQVALPVEGDDEWVTLRLVPVEVFGDEDMAYGLCDAVSCWSDCNRAEGRIYRVEDIDVTGKSREPGETVEVRVRRADLPWFDKRWGGDQ